MIVSLLFSITTLEMPDSSVFKGTIGDTKEDSCSLQVCTCLANSGLSDLLNFVDLFTTAPGIEYIWQTHATTTCNHMHTQRI